MSQVFSSEWKTEVVSEEEAGDSTDERLRVIGGKREGDCIWRGSRSSFHGHPKGTICDFQREDMVGRQAAVILGKMLWQGWTEIKLCIC